jgi:hypothetical protein
MIRTRDFSMFLAAVLFLVCGIGTTAVWGGRGVETPLVAMVLLANSTTSQPVREAVVVAGEVVDRNAQAARLREKVAAYLSTRIAIAPVTGVADEVAASDTPTNSVITSPRKCINYTVVSWPDRPGVQFREMEGARLITETVTDEDGVEQLVPVLQLPIRTHPRPTPVCLPFDVVGIANDGSMIRNHETALYGIFDRDTVIGYALDGFPIHGNTQGLTLDGCGGTVYESTYRYFIDPERDYLLGCFAGGEPAVLP